MRSCRVIKKKRWVAIASLMVLLSQILHGGQLKDRRAIRIPAAMLEIQRGSEVWQHV